jgi:hypothetical protein
MHGFPYTFHISQVKQVIRKAKRQKKYWLLNRVERGILSLSCHILNTVKSPNLILAISEIVDRLEGLMKSKFTQFVANKELDVIKQVLTMSSFMRKIVLGWMRESPQYLRYLALMEINQI